MKTNRVLLFALLIALLAGSLSACRRSDGRVDRSGPTLEPTLSTGVDQSIDDLDQILQGFDQDRDLFETPIGP